MIYVMETDLKQFCLQALAAHNVRSDVAEYVATGLVQTSLRGVDSHGVRLLPHYLSATKAGRLNPEPNYHFEQTSSAVGRLDGDHTFGHAAGAEGMQYAIKLAQEAGMGSIAVYNSSHFGAAAYFALMATEQDMIGLSFTQADSLLHSYGGHRAYFGTNPICFAAPSQTEEPFCLDMAPTHITWNQILQIRASGEKLPSGLGVDEYGHDTNDAHKARSLSPIGGYKGFGLSMLVEILCSLLTGMSFGSHISRMYADPIDQKRYLGQFFMAIRLDCFGSPVEFKARLQQMMAEVRAEPALDPEQPIMVPGDPEKQTAKERTQTGIPIPDHVWQQFQELAQEFNLSIDYTDV